MSYIISWFVMEMCFNAKTQVSRKKWEFAYFSLLAYLFVKCAVARSLKAFFILTNISKHIFWKINTCMIQKQKIKKSQYK